MTDQEPPVDDIQKSGMYYPDSDSWDFKNRAQGPEISVEQEEEKKKAEWQKSAQQGKKIATNAHKEAMKDPVYAKTVDLQKLSNMNVNEVGTDLEKENLATSRERAADASAIEENNKDFEEHLKKVKDASAQEARERMIASGEIASPQEGAYKPLGGDISDDDKKKFEERQNEPGPTQEKGTEKKESVIEDKTGTSPDMKDPDLMYRHMEKVGAAIAQAAAEMGGQMVSRGWDLAGDIVRMTFTQPHAMSSTSRMIGTAMGSLEMAGDFADRAAQKYGINLQQDPELMKDTIKYKLYKREAQQANGVVGNTFRAIAGSLDKMGVQDISQMTPDQLSQHVADMRQEAARLSNIIAQDKANTQLGKRQNRLSSQDRALVYAQAKHLQSYMDQLSKQGATMAADQRAMARQQRQASRQQRLQAQSTLANGQANPYQQILQWADPNANWEIDGKTGMPTKAGTYNTMLRTLRDKRAQEIRANGKLTPERQKWYDDMDSKLMEHKNLVDNEARRAPLRPYGNVFVGISDYAPGIRSHLPRILKHGDWSSLQFTRNIRGYLAGIVGRGGSSPEYRHARALLLSLDLSTKTRALRTSIGTIDPRAMERARLFHDKEGDPYRGHPFDAVEAEYDEAELGKAYEKFNSRIPKDVNGAQRFDPEDPAFRQALNEYQTKMREYKDKWFPLRDRSKDDDPVDNEDIDTGGASPGAGGSPKKRVRTGGKKKTATNVVPGVVPKTDPTKIVPDKPLTQREQQKIVSETNRKARNNLKSILLLKEQRDKKSGMVQQPLSRDERVKQIGALIGDDLLKGVNEWGRFTDEGEFQTAYGAFKDYLNRTYPGMRTEGLETDFVAAFAPNDNKDKNDVLRSANADLFKKDFEEGGIELGEDGRFKSMEDYKRAKNLLLNKYGANRKSKIKEGLKQFIPVAKPAPKPKTEKIDAANPVEGADADVSQTEEDTPRTNTDETEIPQTPVVETEQPQTDALPKDQKKENTDEFVEDEEVEGPANVPADAEVEGGQETEDFSKTNPIAAGLLQHESLRGAGVDTPEKLDDLVLKLIDHVNANTTRTDVKIGISTKKLGSSKGWKQYREDMEAGKDVQRPTDTKRLTAFMEAMKDLGLIDKDKQRFDDEDVDLAETLFSRVAEGKLSGRMEQIAPEYIAKVQEKYDKVLKDAAKINRFGKNLWKVDVDRINTNSEDDDFFTKFYASLIQEHPLGEDGKPDQVLTDFEAFMKMSEDDVRSKYKSSAGEAIWKAKAIEEFVNTPMEGGGLDGRWPGMKQEDLDTQVVREPMPQLQMEDGSSNPEIWSQLGRFMNSYRGASKEEKNAALGDVKEYHKALQKVYERTGKELSNPEAVNNAVKEYTADLEAKAEEKCRKLKASRDSNAEARFLRKMAENQEKYKSGEWSERTLRSQTTRITNLRDAELEESERKYQTDMDREKANFGPQIRQRTEDFINDRNDKIDRINDVADSWSAFTRDMNLGALSAKYALNRIPLPPELQKKENVRIYETMEPQKYIEDFENLVNPYAKVDSVKEYLDKIKASIKERYAEEGEIQNKKSIEMYRQKLETIAKKAQDQIDKEEMELANAPDESEDIHEAYREKTTPLLEKLKEANDKGVMADEWLVNRLNQLTDEIDNNPDLSDDFKQEWTRSYAEEGARRDQIVSELQAADEARRQTEEANKEAARKLRAEQLKTYITQAIKDGSIDPAFLEPTIRHNEDLSDEDKKALWDMLHPDSGEVIDEADVGGETPIHKAPENKYVEEEGEEDSDRFNGAASLEDWRDDLEYEFRGTDSLPDKDVLKKFENEIARIEDPEKKQEYESWLDRMKEHTHLFGKIDKIFFMEDPDMVDNLVDLIQNRDWGQLYQDIRGHNLNDEVDRKTEFAEALEDSGVEDKEIQYIMEVVGPILDGLEIKKSFRDIMRERNPDWE